MSDRRNTNDRNNDRNKNNQQKKKSTPPSEDVKRFYSWGLKKYKKKRCPDKDCSKKKLKKYFNGWRLDLLPEVIMFLFRHGQEEANKEVRDDIYCVLTSPDFIESLEKALDDDEVIENIGVFPTIAYDIFQTAERYTQEKRKEDPDYKGYDMDDLISIIKKINKKGIKNLVKKGIDEDLAFDLMCVFPTPIMIRYQPGKRTHTILTVIYAHAKTKQIPVEKLMSALFKKVPDEELAPVLWFTMLERKEKYVNFTDTQKEAFNDVSVWTFKVLENMDKEDIAMVLREYFKLRKRDKAQNKDAARRFFIGTLPEDEYPRILSVVKKMKERDASIEEFL